jgi:hypothetical protein
MPNRTTPFFRVIMVFPKSGVQVIEDRSGNLRLRSKDGGRLEIEPEVAAALSIVAARCGAAAAEDWLRERLDRALDRANIYADEVGRYYRCGKHLCVRPA